MGEIKESDINLDIALRLERMLTEKGYEVEMTRRDNGGLCNEGEKWTKDSDMQIRKNQIVSGEYDLFLSVHQNSHSDTSCRGGQVFYSDSNPENGILADIVQEKLKKCAPFENRRSALINNDYKLLRGNSMPSAIIECGFMTCPSELELLLDENYKEKIAEYIAEGIDEYIKNRN